MNADYVVFDLETTGLSPQVHEIIQIAAVRVRGGRMLERERFFSFVKPASPIPRFITSYTGISNRDVSNAPDACSVLKSFSGFVGESTLIAHNGQRFDAKFLDACCGRGRVPIRSVALIDSIYLSKMAFGRERGRGHGLDAVLTRLQITEIEGRRHDARGDVTALGRAIEIMWRRLGLDDTWTGVPRANTSLPKIR